MKKLISLCLALVLVFAMAAPAMALTTTKKTDSGYYTSKTGSKYPYSITLTGSTTSGTGTFTYGGTDNLRCTVTATIYDSVSEETGKATTHNEANYSVSSKVGNTFASSTGTRVDGEILNIQGTFLINNALITVLTLS